MKKVRLNKSSPRKPSGTLASAMPGTSRLLMLVVAPVMVSVRVAASEYTYCHLPCTRVMPGCTEYSRVSMSLSFSSSTRASMENFSSAGSPMGMS